MTKSYTWSEIARFLQRELFKTHHIMTYGTLGSCNVETDIDTIITKKPGSSSSSFFKEVHQLMDRVDNYLKKHHGARLIRTSRFSDQVETEYIAKIAPNDLVFQVLTYVSWNQIQKHWYADLKKNERLSNLMRTQYCCLLGTPRDLFRSTFRQFKNEHLFIRLNDSDRIHSHFPHSLLLHRMNVLFDYVLKKRLGRKSLKAKNKEQVREIFYKICRILEV